MREKGARSSSCWRRWPGKNIVGCMLPAVVARFAFCGEPLSGNVILESVLLSREAARFTTTCPCHFPAPNGYWEVVPGPDEHGKERGTCQRPFARSDVDTVRRPPSSVCIGG